MPVDFFSLQTYHYALPQELIAQYPAQKRSSSRLMIIDRQKQTIEDIPFHDIATRLKTGDTLILNDTKVIPARLWGRKDTGANIEILLTRRLQDGLWQAIAKPARKLTIGTIVHFNETLCCQIIDINAEGERILKFTSHDGNHVIDESIFACGAIPLPHYIQREEVSSQDLERYQTVYAAQPGAVAAPTAGLHFSKELLANLTASGIEQTTITLHVGIGTFRPVQVDDIRNHKMHKEQAFISQETAILLNNSVKPARKICVGTTACRTLETAAATNGKIISGEYDTDIFIYPGYHFKATDALLTNFHLPCSTLLMLVSAFAGYDLIMAAYQRAVEEKFRFFSYGDAMLII